MSNFLTTTAVRLLLERPGEKLSFAEHVAELERTGGEILRRATAVSGNPANREKLAHITGIERWGQRRLRVFLDLPYIPDEYESYRPAADSHWPELQDAFKAARQDTIQLARELEAHKVNPQVRVVHNQFGELSARGWLVYLRRHAQLESRRLR